MKTLDEWDCERERFHNNLPIKNGIACPLCGEELYDTSPTIQLTSFPPKKNIHCEKCNYTGFRID